MNNSSEEECPDPIVTGGGRDAIENALRQPTVIDRFPSASAGAPVATVLEPSFPSQYDKGVNSHDNLYTPFSSRLDWEVARWAKLRGPGSNALTELLRIDGVRVQ